MDSTFVVEDVFVIGERLVAAGSVTQGSLQVGDELLVRGMPGTHQIIGIERFRESLSEVVEGESAGLTIQGLQSEDLTVGDELKSAPRPSVD